jgi:hypothetical protein
MESNVPSEKSCADTSKSSWERPVLRRLAADQAHAQHSTVRVESREDSCS